MWLKPSVSTEMAGESRSSNLSRGARLSADGDGSRIFINAAKERARSRNRDNGDRIGSALRREDSVLSSCPDDRRLEGIEDLTPPSSLGGMSQERTDPPQLRRTGSVPALRLNRWRNYRR